MKIPSIGQFRLVEGTGLSLQLGHRQSVDIDLFSDKDFDKDKMLEILKTRFSAFTLNWRNENGFTSIIDNVKIDLFNWHVPFVMPPLAEDNLILMDKREIASMKFEAITTRKDKKDFYDIAFLLNEFSLKEIFTTFRIKYPYINLKLILESLMAVDYADETSDPVILKPVTWTEVKQQIVKTVEHFFAEQKQEAEQKQHERLRKAEELLKNKKDKK